MTTRRARHADKILLVDYDDYRLPEVPTALFSKNKTEKWRRETFRQDRQPKPGLLPLVANGRNDPVCIVAVIDCLMRVTGNPYIVASALTDVLNEEYPYIRWDNVTVGRILSELAAIAETLFLQPDDVAPISYTTWSSKRVYLLNHSVRGHQWWGAIREQLASEAEDQNAIFRAGGEYDRTPTIWTSIEKYELGGVAD